MRKIHDCYVENNHAINHLDLLDDLITCFNLGCNKTYYKAVRLWAKSLNYLSCCD